MDNHVNHAVIEQNLYICRNPCIVGILFEGKHAFCIIQYSLALTETKADVSKGIEGEKTGKKIVIQQLVPKSKVVKTNMIKYDRI